MLKVFRDRLLAHHDDEERDLFPTALRTAQLWKQLEPAVQAIANGYLPRLDSALLHELSTRCHEAKEIMSMAVVYGST
jgi:hypothetical protein